MKFGIREICNVVFKAKDQKKIGQYTFKKGQPVLYIDSAKTSSMEGAATTVYATGGRGNNRLVAWEGERTLTFTVEDALLSPISFSMLSGAGVLKGEKGTADERHLHMTANATIDGTEIDLTEALTKTQEICSTAPIFIAPTEKDGSITGEIIELANVSEDKKSLIVKTEDYDGTSVFVDFYVKVKADAFTELQVDMEHFGGYFYVEANSLWRDEDGTDHAVEITLPTVKIQSNFTFNYAATGDPSTFSFVMDAFPGYTYFNPNKKVLMAMQIVDEAIDAEYTPKSVFEHTDTEKVYADTAKQEEFEDSLKD